MPCSMNARTIPAVGSGRSAHGAPLPRCPSRRRPGTSPSRPRRDDSPRPRANSSTRSKSGDLDAIERVAAREVAGDGLDAVPGGRLLGQQVARAARRGDLAGHRPQSIGPDGYSSVEPARMRRRVETSTGRSRPSAAGCSTSATSRLAMKRPVRTGVPLRVTSLTSTTPRAVVTSIRRPALRRDDLECLRAALARVDDGLDAIALHRCYRASRVTEVTSRSRSILVSTRASCWSEVTLKVAVIDGGAVGMGGDRRRHDVDLVLGDDVRDLVEQARPVERGDADRDRVGLLAGQLPLDVDQPLDVPLGQDRRAGRAVDRHALAARHVAGDLVAGDRRAALREANEQVADALDLDAGGRRRGRRRLLGQHDRGVVVDLELADDRRRADGAVADGGVEVVELLVAVLRRDLGQLGRHRSRPASRARGAAARGRAGPCPGRCSRRAAGA